MKISARNMLKGKAKDLRYSREGVIVPHLAA